MKIGIIREGKSPPDSRTPLTPAQCRKLRAEHHLDMVVQSSEVRCFPDDDYRAADVPVVSSVGDCDVLLGVKEVPVDDLIAGKTYFFFSHTIKEQPYNRDLLRAILQRKIRLIDYEVLTDDQGMRLIAFGRFAGMVGAHNALWTYGRRTGTVSLPRMKDCHDYAAAREIYQDTSLPPCRVVLTGTGRVANGAAAVLDDMG
ncbi:MAG: alanine dehydrogenase, partial [Saprospiraceae bacterium]|nr:alanine dehydrogenase [Saprospiraceae bacterium]